MRQLASTDTLQGYEAPVRNRITISTLIARMGWPALSLRKTIGRVALTLTLALLTAATAWADASEGNFTDFLPVSTGAATGYFTYSNHFYKVEWKNINNTVGSVQLYWKTVYGVDVDQKVLEAKYENFLVDLYATATQDDRWQLSSITSLTPGQSSSGLSYSPNFAQGASNEANNNVFVEVCTVTCMEVNTPTWYWSEDCSTCTATFTCTDDPDISTTVDATITTSADRKTASVTFNGTDYSVWIPDPAHFSVNDAGTEYTIHTAEGWGVFCDLLAENTKGYFDNKTVKLGADIEVTRMAGGSYHDFTGTFDGDSHMLTVSYGSASEPVSNDKAAPFRNVENGCLIKNLHVAGHIHTSKQYAGGLVGTQYGTVKIENCRVSTVIHSYTSGEGYHGGIVGNNGNASGSQLTIEGCVFDGKILGTAATTCCGGFVGNANGNNATGLSITQSLYAPAALGEGENEATKDSQTFAYYKNFATTEKKNRYYTRALGSTNNQGKPALSITAGEAMTVAVNGTAYTYNVSGITVYKDANAAFMNGMKYGDVLYAGDSQYVYLTLSRTNVPPAGYQFGDYTASGGTLTPGNSYYTLAMPDQNVTISTLTLIDWEKETTGDTEATAYMIYNKEQLDMLAQRVNGGTSYSGKYFKLGADITYNYSGLGETESNYTRIGTSNYSFSGHFDGQNHVISGIRINGSGDYRGLFGGINGAEVKNVILADAVIKGRWYLGGIVGDIYGGGKVTNCHVLSDVTIEGDQGVSGIASQKEGTVSDCLYLGTILEGNKFIGAIAGWNKSTVKNCYYTDTAISGKDNNGNALDNAASAIGCDDGSTDAATGLAPQDTKDNSAFLTLMAQLNAALTAEERTTPLSTAVDITLNGRTLYKDGAWNTLCLPFDVTIEGSVLDGEGVQAMTLNTKTSGLSKKGILTLNFVSAATIPAGTPFIIKWDKSSTNIVNPMFHGVTVSDATTNDATTDDGSLTFIGTYDPTDIYSADKVNLYLGAGNTLYYPRVEGMTSFIVNAFRAYFHLNDASEANVRSIVLNFDGEATSITPLHAAVDAPSSAVYYTLDGRRLSGKPSARGMYIQGGKKLFIP
ncbi:MAG: hypothetical protein IJR02_01530 [Bacteroidaceae bacterium]|nr:hypothetical protein [Bacteroidaceae bacterium]